MKLKYTVSGSPATGVSANTGPATASVNAYT